MLAFVVFFSLQNLLCSIAEVLVLLCILQKSQLREVVSQRRNVTF